MQTFTIRVLDVKGVTHNVRCFTVQKPQDYHYTPGQATDLSILKPGWETEKRPFTFTSLPGSATLEFTIKCYTDHQGVTNQLSLAQTGDSFEISESWGAIEYKGEGTFIAGGAGITPFIAILRFLYANNQIGKNRLFFSNKTSKDIIRKEELMQILGGNLVNVITQETNTGYLEGRIDVPFLKKNISDFTGHFYVCGPDAFTSDVLKALGDLGANPEALVFEK